MRVEDEGRKVVLSRRNLLSLLSKLDKSPPSTVCTIIGGSEANGLFVLAEEDDVHYERRAPGPMIWATEKRMQSLQDTRFAIGDDYGMDAATILGDLKKISTWLAEDTDNQESQGASSDLNAIVETLHRCLI